MHAVSLLEELYASSSKQGKTALQKPSAWVDHLWGRYCRDMSDSSHPPILKPVRWQDCCHDLCQVKPAETEGCQGGVGELPWGFWLTQGIDYSL